MSYPVTPAAQVYSNSLILSNILSRVPAKKDLVSCLVAARQEFITVVKVLYAEAGEEVMDMVIERGCGTVREITYRCAVRHIILKDRTFPNSIDIFALRSLYPRLSNILFSLPQIPAFSRSTRGPHGAISSIRLLTQRQSRRSREEVVQARSEDDGSNNEGRGGADSDAKHGTHLHINRNWSSPYQGLSVVGELALGFDGFPIWRCIKLGDLEFAIAGPGKRFRLVSLALGKYLPFDQPVQQPPCRFSAICDVEDQAKMQAIFADLRHLHSQEYLTRDEVVQILSCTKVIQDLAVIFPLDGWSKPPDDLILDHIRKRKLMLDRCGIVIKDRGYSNTPGLEQGLGELVAYEVTISRIHRWKSDVDIRRQQPQLRRYIPPPGPRKIVAPRVLTLLVGKSCWKINPFTFACSVTSQWPADTVIEIFPQFHTPSEMMVQWIRTVKDTIYLLIRTLRGGSQSGSRRVQGPDEAEDSEDEDCPCWGGAKELEDEQGLAEEDVYDEGAAVDAHWEAMFANLPAISAAT